MPDTQPAAPMCACCRADLHTGWTTCGDCQQWLRDQLNDIEHLWQVLPEYIERGASRDTNVGGSRTPAMPPNAEVLDLTSEGGIVTVLEAREEDWRRARPGFGAVPWRGSLDQRLAGTVRWLRLSLDWACEHYPDTDDLARDLQTLTGRCRAVIDAEPRQKRFEVYCDQPAAVEGEDPDAECRGVMRIGINSTWADCPACGHHHDRASLERLDSQYGPNPSRQPTAA